MSEHPIQSAAEEPILRVPWVFTISDLQRNLIGQLTVRFTGESANSCMAGEWKRIEVVDYRPQGAPEFPGNDPLSYTMEDGTLTIGRNEVCDRYVWLKGDVTDTSFTGKYLKLGLGGVSRLGYAQGAPVK